MLVIFNNDCFEIVQGNRDQYQLRKPFSTTSKSFWVAKTDVRPYIGNSDAIVRRWIPDFDNLQIWEVQKYLLESITNLLTPQYLMAPKDVGVYIAIWIKDQTFQITWVLYSPNDARLSEDQHLEGFDLYVLPDMSWIPLKFFISRHKYLRFIPFNFGYTYCYLQHLIESDYFTPEEIREIWESR